MANGIHPLWARHGFYDILYGNASRTQSRVRRLTRILDILNFFNANDGAEVFKLSLSDAKHLFVFTQKADLVANEVLSDPNATVEEMSLAFKIKLEAAKTLFYLAARPDWEEIIKWAQSRGKDLEEHIPPIIEEHVEQGNLAKDDLPEGL